MRSKRTGTNYIPHDAVILGQEPGTPPATCVFGVGCGQISLSEGGAGLADMRGTELQWKLSGHEGELASGCQ